MSRSRPDDAPQLAGVRAQLRHLPGVSVARIDGGLVVTTPGRHVDEVAGLHLFRAGYDVAVQSAGQLLVTRGANPLHELRDTPLAGAVIARAVRECA